MTFIAHLRDGILVLKKNNIFLRKINDLPTNEDLLPSVSFFYVSDEFEVVN